jgi:pimeloyl-ACP methyl ester carboxylesterase
MTTTAQQFEFKYETGKSARCAYAAFGEANHRPPVVFIHGYGAMRQHWNRNIPAAAQIGKTFAMDLLGFGESDKPDAAYGLSLWANQIRAFLESKSLEKIILIGHSMGAAACLWFANEAPEQIESLILVDASGIFPSDFSAAEKLLYRAVGSPVLGEALFGLFANEFGARQSLLPTYFDPAQVTDALVAEFAKPLRSPGAMNAYLAPSRHPERFLLDRFPRPCRFKGRALLCWGEFDRAFPPQKIVPKFQLILPQAETAVIPKTAHCPHHESAEQFNSIMANFLSRI